MRLLSILVLSALLSILTLSACNGKDQPGDDVVTAEEFAQCLTDKGFVMYGTSWDGYTKAQAWAFGKGFSAVNYVRCDDPPGGTSISQECVEANVQYVPTWLGPNDTAVFGYQSLRKLAALSGCDEPEDWLYDAKFELVDCLNDQGATLYSTTWCSYCKMQMEFLGDAAEEVNYVTCDRTDNPYLLKEVCEEQNIIAFPTWIFDDGSRILGFLFPWTLAKQRSCDWPEQPTFDL